MSHTSCASPEALHLTTGLLPPDSGGADHVHWLIRGQSPGRRVDSWIVLEGPGKRGLWYSSDRQCQNTTTFADHGLVRVQRGAVSYSGSCQTDNEERGKFCLRDKTCCKAPFFVWLFSGGEKKIRLLQPSHREAITSCIKSTAMVMVDNFQFTSLKEIGLMCSKGQGKHPYYSNYPSAPLIP